jgi:hypothetical protein
LYDYTINGTKLRVVEEEKDVGIVIHKSLKPARQCERAPAKATGVLMQLAKCFHYRDRNIFLRLYQQYIRPHLEFASPGLETLQERRKVQDMAQTYNLIPLVPKATFFCKFCSNFECKSYLMTSELPFFYFSKF